MTKSLKTFALLAATASHKVVQNGAPSACCQVANDTAAGSSAGKNHSCATDQSSNIATTA